MNQKGQNEILMEIKKQRDQLLEIAVECNSLVHSKVIRKSQEIDRLIHKYYTLKERENEK